MIRLSARQRLTVCGVFRAQMQGISDTSSLRQSSTHKWIVGFAAKADELSAVGALRLVALTYARCLFAEARFTPTTAHYYFFDHAMY